VILLTALTLIYALISGVGFTQSRQKSAEAVTKSAQEKVASQRDKAQQIAEGKIPVPDKPYQDPGNTIYVGSSVSEVAALPQGPLAFLSVGESDLFPPAIPVSARGKESFLFNDEISNPSHLLTGIFDPAFVLVVLLPLFILALTYNVISAEREQGTLSLNAASPVPLRVIMSAKLLVRVAVPVLTAVIVLLAAVLCINPSAFNEVLLVAAAVTVYGLFWGAAALAVNGFGLDSTGNALVMSVLWICTAFVIPAGIDAVVEIVHPAPIRSEMVLAVRNGAVQVETKHSSAQAQYELDHAKTGHTHGEDTAVHTHSDPAMERGSVQEKTYLRLQSIKASQVLGDSIYQNQNRLLDERNRLASILKLSSPVLVMQEILSEIAGTGSLRYRSYSDQVDQFHDSWRTFFITRAERGIRLDGAAYDSFPKFHYYERCSEESAKHIWRGIIVIGLFFLGFSALAKGLLSRFRVAGR